ncbi:MAG: hypothetical protein A2014_09425 [Spirochaetes bacterium GWF1_49_6]|nr:MAG: hypothetical protein A2014_09425 [Spirochaetes bacterium GWF1_49_6]
MRKGNLGIILLFGMTAACGTTGVETIPEYREDYALMNLGPDTNVQVEVTGQSKGNPPVWIKYSWVLGKDNKDNKVIYISVFSKSSMPLTESSIKTPEETAQIMKAVEMFTRDKLEEVKAEVKIDDAKLTPILDKWVLSLSQQVAASYAINVENYWEKMKITAPGVTGEYYRIYKRYMIDFSYYSERATKVWDEVSAKTPDDLKSKGTVIVYKIIMPASQN